MQVLPTSVLMAKAPAARRDQCSVSFAFSTSWWLPIFLLMTRSGIGRQFRACHFEATGFVASDVTSRHPSESQPNEDGLVEAYPHTSQEAATKWTNFQ